MKFQVRKLIVSAINQFYAVELMAGARRLHNEGFRYRTGERRGEGMAGNGGARVCAQVDHDGGLNKNLNQENYFLRKWRMRPEGEEYQPKTAGEIAKFDG
jgi:hypothetical protein